MEHQKIKTLFKQLQKQKERRFPKKGEPLVAALTQGVYVIRDGAGRVVHVGRTLRGLKGIYQRLDNHLRGQSSFADGHLKGDGSRLRDGYTFQYLEGQDNRERALLEYFATAWHCPELGRGRFSSPQNRKREWLKPPRGRSSILVRGTS
jgi:hypothetical protein